MYKYPPIGPFEASSMTNKVLEFMREVETGTGGKKFVISYNNFTSGEGDQECQAKEMS